MRPLLCALCVCLSGILFGPISRGAPEASKPRERQVWAVLIGIDTYRDPAIPSCRGAVRATGELRDWIGGTAAWGIDHTLLMNEHGAPRHGRPDEAVRILVPTRENLDWALTEWLGARVQPSDVVVIYFAGQAAVAGGRELLVPLDARLENLANTGWTPEAAVDALAVRRHCSVVLWLDTSPWGRGVPVVRGPVDSTAGIRLLNRLTRWPGVTAWLGAEGGASPEGTDRSPFLAALLEGLGQRPSNVLACLDRMQQDAALRHQGFRVRGGVPPDLSLWPGPLLPPHRFKPMLLLQHGHADAVSAIALSSDGEHMVSASRDSTVRIWRVRDRERTLLNILPNHLVGVTALALSPDGRLVASGDGTGRVRIWDVIEQREKRLGGPSPHVQRIVSLAFLPDRVGKRLASLDQDGRCMLWLTEGPSLRVQPLVASSILRMGSARREGLAALALAGEDGTITLVSRDGTPLSPPLAGTGGRPSALDLDPGGARLALGDETGKVHVLDIEHRRTIFRHDYGGRIGAIRIGPAGELAVGSEDRLFLADPSKPGPGLALGVSEDDVEAMGFSPDGRWLNALARNGDGTLWDCLDRAHPAIRPLNVEGPSAGLMCLEFSRDGSRLLGGEGDGGIRSWDLPAIRERPRLAPHRGKVDGLSVSADGRYLLQVTHDRLALVWDLKEGRGARALPGHWNAGTFLPGVDELAMIQAEDQGGGVVLIDRDTGQVRTKLERPLAPGGRQVSRANFSQVAVSRDGRTIAAITGPGQVEIACVWNREGGAPRAFRGHTAPLSGLDLASDGGSLLTSSEDGTVRVWDLKARPAGAAEPAPAVLKALPGRAITAARFVSSDPRRIVTAQLSPGQFAEVVLVEPLEGAIQSRRLGELLGRVHSLVVTPDGQWVGAAGQDGAVHLWRFDARQRPVRAVIEPTHQHTEQVNALIAWPGTPMIASAGDDTTVRLWRLDASIPRGMLVGTLTAGLSSVDRPSAPAVGHSLLPARADWVAFTPEGVYDASLNGDRAVSFVLDHEIRSLEQYSAIFHRFGLTDELRKGSSPPAPGSSTPPGLVIDPPPAPDVKERDVKLTISLADPKVSPEDLRLYQNGVPVQNGRDFQPLEAPGRFAARVRLRSGLNRFYAMAGRSEDVDARSQDVELRFEGPDAPGRIHVIALGVKDYSRNALRFADRDASQMAEFLHANGLQQGNQPGEVFVLTDRAVTEKTVEDHFAALRSRVKGHPEDTVVVFLAGHTDVLRNSSGRERFTLLLPSFPFPAEAPKLASNRGVEIAGAASAPLPKGSDLPFYVLYRNLMHLDALQRLVIVDACQAEAIYNDPGVRTIQRLMDTDARRVRVSYLLAARRGEPANESTVLEHGLLTYVLLRGMQAPNLRVPTIRLPIFEKYPSADEDRDGIVTTGELRVYAENTLPALGGQLPDLARRAGRMTTPPISSRPPPPIRLQGEQTGSFQVVVIPSGGEPGD